jgi:hypothetical protein
VAVGIGQFPIELLSRFHDQEANVLLDRLPFHSSFRGRPRRLRAEPAIQLFYVWNNWIPGSIADKVGNGPGMTSCCS